MQSLLQQYLTILKSAGVWQSAAGRNAVFDLPVSSQSQAGHQNFYKRLLFARCHRHTSMSTNVGLGLKHCIAAMAFSVSNLYQSSAAACQLLKDCSIE